MTLNGVMAVILRYFSEFGYLPGVLRKSSRSLSHLLMSSCQTRLSSLGTLALEARLARTVDFDSIIELFASRKARKAPV